MIGFHFSNYDPRQNGKSKFDQLLELFTQLLTYTSGDVSEALQWLNELDKKYELTDDDYGMGDFIEELKEKGFITEDAQRGEIKIKRIYEPAQEGDGYRILIDRLWPRGIKKADARLDEWNKSLAPSAALRKWFGHQPERYKEFSLRYKKELAAQGSELERIKAINETHDVTLLFAVKDASLSHAPILCEKLKKMQASRERKT